MSTQYRFELVCPACNRQAEMIGDKRVPPPVLNCGNCLMERVEVVEMRVRSAEVLDG
jgi:hypothetical protein